MREKGCPCLQLLSPFWSLPGGKELKKTKTQTHTLAEIYPGAEAQPSVFFLYILPHWKVLRDEAGYSIPVLYNWQAYFYQQHHKHMNNASSYKLIMLRWLQRHWVTENFQLCYNL
jgi:hypothetical protein